MLSYHQHRLLFDGNFKICIYFIQMESSTTDMFGDFSKDEVQDAASNVSLVDGPKLYENVNVWDML